MFKISKPREYPDDKFACGFYPKNFQSILNFVEGSDGDSNENNSEIKKLLNEITSQEREFLTLFLESKKGIRHIDLLDFKYNLLPVNFKNKDKLFRLFILLYNDSSILKSVKI